MARAVTSYLADKADAMAKKPALPHLLHSNSPSDSLKGFSILIPLFPLNFTPRLFLFFLKLKDQSIQTVSLSRMQQPVINQSALTAADIPSV